MLPIYQHFIGWHFQSFQGGAGEDPVRLPKQMNALVVQKEVVISTAIQSLAVTTYQKIPIQTRRPGSSHS
jgi:hypothetical protein